MAIRQALSGFFGRILHPESRSGSGGSLNNPSVPLSAAGFLSWAMGGEPTASGEQITINTALQQITVQACTRVLAESVSSLPAYVYEITGTGRKRAVDHAVADLIRWEPNDEMTAVTFWECFVGSMALTGNGYAEVQREGSGAAVALWPLHPQLTEPMRKDGTLVYKTTDGMASGWERLISAANVLHCPLFCFDGLKGFSPVHLARQGIGLGRASEKYGARFFGNGGRPGGILSSTGTLTPVQLQQMRETWNKTQGGDAAGSTAVLPGSWTYAQIGLSPEESQFLLTRNFQRAEIASIFRVPPHMVGDTSRLSNNNHEQMGLAFVTDTIRPYLARIEAELRRKLLPKIGRNAGRHEIEFDVSERLRCDFQTTMQGNGVGKQWGFLSTNDVRRSLDLNPIGPEGDVYWAPSNMQNSKLLLNTESIQDQPVGSGPDAPGPDSNDPNAPPPSPAERNLFGRYTRSYITIFKDVFSRLLKRDKRDSDTIAALLGPLLTSMSEAAAPGDLNLDEARAVIVRDAIAGMAKRAEKWPKEPAADHAAELMQFEFKKLVRSLHVNLAREAAALKAFEEVA